MKKKLIIDKTRGKATFVDDEKAFNVPILSASVNADCTDFAATGKECEVTLEFLADEVEIV